MVDADMSPRRGRSRSLSRSRERSRSRSRSRGNDDNNRARSPSPPPAGNAQHSKDPNTETIEVSEADAAFVLGRGGNTKRKLARVSGAKLELHDSKSGGTSVLEISGDDSSRQRAKDYVKYVLTQRVGPVHIDPGMKRDDMSIVQVPEDCVGFVMGKGGQVLRAMEDEWTTLMFFAKSSSGDDTETVDKKGTPHFGGEILAIFGTRRGRRGSELKVMSAVEHKKPGTFLTANGDALKSPLQQPGDDENDGFDYDLFPFRGDEFSYALGARGSTRKKLAAASGAIIEYIAQTAVLAGNESERARGKDYLTWLLKQKEHGAMDVEYEGRDDVSVVDVPKNCMGYLTGYRGEGLRGIEHETRTFIFSNGGGGGDTRMDNDDKNTSSDEKKKSNSETLLIFGDVANDRKRAVRIVEDRVDQAKRGDMRRDDRGGHDGDRGRGRDDRGRDDRRDDRRRDDRREYRSRSPPRRDYDRRDDRRDDRGRQDDRYDRRSPDRRYRSRSPDDRRGRGRGSDVCFDWQKGRCNRDRCKFKHENGGRDRSRDRGGGRDQDRNRGRDNRRDRDRSYSRERR